MSKSSIEKRILIDRVRPLLDNGRYPIKREEGDEYDIRADVFRDGHDRIVVWLLYKNSGTKQWTKVPMVCTNPGLDLWEAQLKAELAGLYEYRIEAYCDYFASWLADTRKKVEANVDIDSELKEGLDILSKYCKWADSQTKKTLKSLINKIKEDRAGAWEIITAPDLLSMLSSQPDPDSCVTSDTFLLRVDRVRARFAAWYECFPRSCGFVEGRSGTFKDVEKRLPDIQAMGFDVLYFPPIHPIGHTKRKGPNNSLVCSPSDPGCPYSIGSEVGGHDAIEPSLGTLKDFADLVQKCHEHGIEIAFDFAINCSPDHPYLKAHPEWFSHRPDGTIKFAENPPKKYEDIYPLNFDTKDRQGLWNEMKRIILFWCKKGVRIFRVDNPHTKPFAFWGWLIAEVQADYPDVIFLAEAFTRPKVMKALAKLGFTQSYSYFTWRTEKQELTDYFSEITSPDESYYMRANLFTNTPDIFPFHLQTGGRNAYKIRAVLASTLSSVYGIFQGFELCDGIPIPGREEYLNSDKYEIRTRDWNQPGNIKDYISALNRIRRENRALQEYDNLRFHASDDKNILCYSKSFGENQVLVAVNLDPHNMHHSFVYVPAEHFGLSFGQTFQVHDLITDRRYLWQGEKNYVELDPNVEPAHIFRLYK